LLTNDEVIELTGLWREQMWRMAYLRGPEGIIVALAQRIG
jgi:hypothetical protein